MPDDSGIEAGEPIAVAAPDDQDEPTSGDPLLNLMVHLAHMGTSCGVTLYTRGSTLTGHLCSSAAYYQACIDQAPGTYIETVYRSFLNADVARPSIAPGDPTPDYLYVHLLKGQVIAPGVSGMPNGGFPIRVLRDEVIGFSIGQLS